MTELIEEQGLDPLHIILNDLGGWPILMGNQWNESNFDWKESIYKNRRYGYSVDLLITFEVDVDQKNSTKRMVYVSDIFFLFQHFCLYHISNYFYFYSYQAGSSFVGIICKIFIERIRERDCACILRLYG